MKIKFSRKGSKDNRLRLAWSKYFKFTLENKEYYFKQKAYATHCDGYIDTQKIVKQTYKNAIKRGNNCIEIKAEDGMTEDSLYFLELVLSEEYRMAETVARKLISKARAATEKIKKDVTMSSSTEYKIFKGILDTQINLLKGETPYEMRKL